jgi:hypothetical protein
MEVSSQLYAPAALPTGKEPLVSHWIGGWVGPRAVMNAVVKRKIPSTRQESNLDCLYYRTVKILCKDNWSHAEIRIQYLMNTRLESQSVDLIVRSRLFQTELSLDFFLH